MAIRVPHRHKESFSDNRARPQVRRCVIARFYFSEKWWYCNFWGDGRALSLPLWAHPSSTAGAVGHDRIAALVLRLRDLPRL
jgi:hypothetical protein